MYLEIEKVCNNVRWKLNLIFYKHLYFIHTYFYLVTIYVNHYICTTYALTYFFWVLMYIHMHFKYNTLVYPRKKNYPVLPTTQLAFKAKQGDSSVGSEVLFWDKTSRLRRPAYRLLAPTSLLQKKTPFNFCSCGISLCGLAWEQSAGTRPLYHQVDLGHLEIPIPGFWPGVQVK